MSDNTETPQEAGIRRAGTNGNLIPPVKGEIRNPNGRGKGVKNRSTVYRELVESMALKSTNPRLDTALAECFPAKPKTIADQVAAAMVMTALAGDVAAAREVMDSAYGKLTDNVNTTHSFRKMGKVEAVQTDAAGASAPVALTFDIGEDAAQPDNEVEEGEDDE